MITKEYLQQELAKRIGGYKRGVETTTDNIIAEMKSILVLVDALQDRVKDYDDALEKAKVAYKDTDKHIKATIERIFPELRESEDERIIEEIKFAVMQMPTERQDTKNRCLTWLEKQKEQKLAEWDELQADFRNINEAFEDGKKEVVAHPEKYGLCKPAEWSEDDERTLTHIQSHLKYLIEHRFEIKDYNTMEDKMILESEIEWLKNRFKSLRPQPKQEWSEDDKKMLDAMIDIVSGSFYEPLCPRKEMLAWLKSLRPSLM